MRRTPGPPVRCADFLTPGRGDSDLDSGLDRLLSVPRRRLRAELTRLHTHIGGPVPAGVCPLADGCPQALRRLGSALRAYHRVAVEPCTAAIRAQAAADRTVRAEAVLARGAEGLLTGYDRLPGRHYRNGLLRAPYPVERELLLEGRALTLVPAFSCVRTSLTLAGTKAPIEPRPFRRTAGLPAGVEGWYGPHRSKARPGRPPGCGWQRQAY